MKIGEEAAQDILNQRPDVEGFNFREYGDLMRRLAAQYRTSTSTVARIWRRQAYAHLRRKED